VPTLNEARFTAFHARHARDLWAYVYRVTGHAADADDLVQEAFLRLLRAGPAEVDDEQLRRFLFRVASNLIVDRWRQRAKQGDRARRGEDGEPTMPATESNDDVARTFAQLRPRERALLWLAYVEEESHEAIAESLGVGKRSIRVLLFRAKRRLRDLLRARGLART
jgi:RNA polymerase sigma-70 factor (ECF subfamily)